MLVRQNYTVHKLKNLLDQMKRIISSTDIYFWCYITVYFQYVRENKLLLLQAYNVMVLLIYHMLSGMEQAAMNMNSWETQLQFYR